MTEARPGTELPRREYAPPDADLVDGRSMVDSDVEPPRSTRDRDCDAARFSETAAEPEDVRNRLLRRVDWRFLLADPSPDVSVVFGDDALREAVRRISTSLVGPAEAIAGTCSLAVAADPTMAELKDAFAALRVGGSCYVEWRGRFVSASALRTALRSAGFDDVQTYWPWPTLESCRAWVPLDDTSVAASYFRIRRSAMHGVARPLVRSVLDRTALLRQRLSGTVTMCGIGRKPGPNLVESTVSQAVRLFDPAQGGPRCATPAFHTVLQTAGPRSDNKVVGLVFVPGQRGAALAIKFARVADAGAALAREADTLDALHALDDWGDSIPRVLLRSCQGQTFSIVETAVAGGPIAGLAKPRAYRDVATAGTRWLTRLALASKSASPVSAEIAAAAVRDFEAAYADAIDPSVTGFMKRGFEPLSSLPAVCEHRDFSPHNVFIGRGKSLSVVDWESSVLRGVPGLDLVYFLSYLTSLSNRVPLARDIYRSAWNPSSPNGRVNLECVSDYLSAVGVDPGAFKLLRLLTWVVHARSEYLRYAADAGGRADVQTLRGGVFLSLIDDEVRGRTIG